MAICILSHEGSAVRRAHFPSDPVTAAGQRIAWAHGRLEQAEVADRPAEVRRLEHLIDAAERVIAGTASTTLAGAMTQTLFAAAEV